MSNNIQLPHQSHERRRRSPEDPQFNGAANSRRNIVLAAAAAVNYTKQGAGYGTNVFVPHVHAAPVTPHSPILNALTPGYLLDSIQAIKQPGHNSDIPQADPGNPAENPESVILDVENPNWIPGLAGAVNLGRPAVMGVEEMQDAA
jgi:hypothetical protein